MFQGVKQKRTNLLCTLNGMAYVFNAQWEIKLTRVTSYQCEKQYHMS